MKKQYVAPEMDVVELKHKTVLLIGSPETMQFTNDPDLIINDPEEIH